MARFPTPRNRRLAAEVYEEAFRPCFLTLRAAHGGAPFASAHLNATLIALLHERLASACRLYAFCLMPDHLHVLTAPDSDGASVLTFIDRRGAHEGRGYVGVRAIRGTKCSRGSCAPARDACPVDRGAHEGRGYIPDAGFVSR